MKRPFLIIFLIVFALLFSLLTPTHADAPPVTATDNGARIVLDNGILALTLVKKNATVTSVLFRHDGKTTETCAAFYFDSNGGAAVVPDGLTAPRAGYEPLGSYVRSVTLARQTPDLAEVVLTGGPTSLFPFVTEIHYVLRRGESGIYAFAIYRHGAEMAAGSVGQCRFVFKGPPGPSLFTNHIVDDKRQGPFPISPAVQTVSDATFLLSDGSVYTKYDNSVFLGDHFLHGMAGHGVGVWMVNASNEFVNGGPIKQELTVHMDNTLLNMLQGGHFGSGGIETAAGEVWTKFYGPFFVYFNHGANVKSLYAEAKKRTQIEKSLWPYAWEKDADYPVKRGTVTGKIHLTDGQSARGAWIILAAPGGDWPLQSKGYEFWTRADDAGNFNIKNVRPGTYALYADGANQFAPYENNGVTVGAGETNTLGTLDWTPVTHGRTLWQIGVADRSSAEFFDGENVRHWANFLRYPKNFPNDVTFVIGKSCENIDWNFAQWTWYSKKPVWTIQFELPETLTGEATLTLGIAAANPLHGGRTNTEIGVNGKQIATLHLKKSGAAAYRSGGQDSAYQMETVKFDAALLHAGQNAITLGDKDATPFPSPEIQKQGRVGAIMYDAIRLEIDERPAAERLPTLFLVGDSTVKNGTKGEQGWGEAITPFFDATKIHLDNRARGGRSSRTFQTEGLWDAVLAASKPGDFVLIQMGHNDGGPVNDDSRARGSIRGIGEETQEIENLLTKKREIVHTYGWYLRKYVADARARGLTPILCSPVPHCPQSPVSPGDVEKSGYVGWSREVAESLRVPFLDLNRLILSRYVGLSPADIKSRFFTPADNTHTSPAGAALNAAAVADGLRALLDSPLRNFLAPEKAEKDEK